MVNCSIASYALLKWDQDTSTTSQYTGSELSISSAGVIHADTNLFLHETFVVQITTGPQVYSYITAPFQIVIDCTQAQGITEGSATNPVTIVAGSASSGFNLPVY
jgi:hypothetical protein